MPLKIIRNDITKVAADAIVNTANYYPRVGAGTDTAIHTAAGPALLEARKEIGNISPGNSIATPAFNLPAKYVLHTVASRWKGGGHREEETLRKAYNAALGLAESLGCRSVAFPLMATGCYGFPRNLALSIALGVFYDYLVDHDTTIYLVLFSGESFGMAESMFGDLKSYIDDHYVDQEKEKEYESFSPDDGWDYESEQEADKDQNSINDGEWDIDFSAKPVSTSFDALLIKEQLAAPCYASLPEYLQQKESSFTEYLWDMLRERDVKSAAVYKRAEISRQLFSRILSTKDYQPTKSTALQLAIGFQLNLDQTEKLLKKAGYALTNSSATDLVVKYFIEQKVYSVTFINAALHDCGLPPLKTGLKA